MTFNEKEVELIREFLSAMACGYKRETTNYDCCEAKELIRRIDNQKDEK